MSSAARLLKEESEQNREERREIRGDMFRVRDQQDRALNASFTNRQRIQALEAEQRVLWLTIYILFLYNILMGIVFLYNFLNKIH